MSSILFHGSLEMAHIADRLKHHRFRRDPLFYKTTPLTPQALIVDDEVESIQPLQLVLRNFGFEITLAFDGQEALDEVSGKSFDIIFLDISLPQMTGLELLQQVEIIQDHRCKFNEHKTPIVTYSSYCLEKFNIPNGEKFFFAGHWQKPISLSELTIKTGQTMSELGIQKK